MENQKKALFAILLLSAMTMNVTAASPDHDSEWTVGKDCDWTPTFTSVEANGFTDSSHLRTDFNFSQTSLNAVSDSGYYFTCEHRANVDDHASVTEMYSFLPNPHFDKDDDGDLLFGLVGKDGYYEEAEVVCTTTEDIVVGKNYYFATWWDIPDGLSSSAFDLITQLSNYSSLTGEYNEKCSDYINSYGWTYPPTSTSAAVATTAQHETTSAEGSASVDTEDHKIQKLVTGIETLSELDDYKDSVTAEYLELLNGELTTASLHNTDASSVTADAVITFNTPVSMEYLVSLLNENVALVNYEAKILNQENEWMTMWSMNPDENRLMNIATEMSGMDELTFCGVTSAVVSIPVDDSTYSELCAEEDIYLVDMSDYIIKKQNNDFTLDVSVSDCYYYLETRAYE